MSRYTYYHNPRCSKSRQGLTYLQEKGIEPTIRLYMDEAFDEIELKSILDALKMTAQQLARKKEAAYKEQALADASDDKVIAAMLNEPKLIERPILVKGKRAVIGRPTEAFDDLL